MNDMIRQDERIGFALRSLYSSRGYSRYKMSKFEEYELYVRNKDFLISEGVITFTDTNGRLMALKPDVTLSIVKNSRDIPGCVQKVYYNENVYRVSKGSNSYREIMQVGLECIGDIDDHCILEVLSLAAKSLRCISESCVLALSHLGVVSGLLEDVNAADRKAILACIGEKNAHGLAAACEKAGVPEKTAALTRLVAACGSPEEVIRELRCTAGDSDALDQLETLCSALAAGGFGDMLRIDFSVVSDANYYNGVVFKGFIEGVPESVLSGGRYDSLLRRMGRRSGAVGFAVYLDQLERLDASPREYDVDMLLLYDDGADLAGLDAAMNRLNENGLRVTAQKSRPDKLRFRQLARYSEGEVILLEDA